MNKYEVTCIVTYEVKARSEYEAISLVELGKRKNSITNYNVDYVKEIKELPTIDEKAKEVIDGNLKHLAESTIEGWSSRWVGFTKGQLYADLGGNDTSPDIDFLEEELGRELEQDEIDYFEGVFADEIVNQYFN